MAPNSYLAAVIGINSDRNLRAQATRSQFSTSSEDVKDPQHSAILNGAFQQGKMLCSYVVQHSHVYEIPAKVAEERRTGREPEIPDKGVS
jgi:hypothetical protein